MGLKYIAHAFPEFPGTPWLKIDEDERKAVLEGIETEAKYHRRDSLILDGVYVQRFVKEIEHAGKYLAPEDRIDVDGIRGCR